MKRGSTGVPWSPECGARVRRCRERRGLTQLELSRLIGRNNCADLCYVERASRPVSGATAVKLADALNVSLDWLLGRDEPAPPAVAVEELSHAQLGELARAVGAEQACRRVERFRDRGAQMARVRVNGIKLRLSTRRRGRLFEPLRVGA